MAEAHEMDSVLVSKIAEEYADRLNDRAEGGTYSAVDFTKLREKVEAALPQIKRLITLAGPVIPDQYEAIATGVVDLLIKLDDLAFPKVSAAS